MEITVEDVERAEALAKELAELEMGGVKVGYTSRFDKVSKGLFRRKKVERYGENIEVDLWTEAVRSLKGYRKIVDALKNIAETWKKRSSSDGRYVILSTTIKNIDVEVWIRIAEKKVATLMGKIFDCEIVESVTKYAARETTSYACKVKPNH